MPLKSDYKDKFKKQLRKISKADQDVVNDEINNFLAGKKVDIRRLDDVEWRLKVNDWRVFFDYEGDLITFTSVKRRTSKTY